jgi:hypothetical protein
LTVSSTVRELEAAQAEDLKPDEAAQHEIANCDGKLRQHGTVRPNNKNPRSLVLLRAPSR